MIPALLASIGLPLLTKLVGGALGLVDHPVARNAAQALSMVGDAITTKEISPEQLAEANRHVERMAEIESTEATSTIAQVNDTIRTETRSEDAYVRRWRPTFGYAVALTWTAVMGAIAWAIVAVPAEAPGIISALTNTSAIWGVALGVLGVSVVQRSRDKQVAAGAEPPAPARVGSGLAALVAAVKGKSGG